MKNFEEQELKRLQHFAKKRRLTDKERRRIVVLEYKIEVEEKLARI